MVMTLRSSQSQVPSVQLLQGGVSDQSYTQVVLAPVCGVAAQYGRVSDKTLLMGTVACFDAALLQSQSGLP